MKLTKRAQFYIKTLERQDHWKTTMEEAKNYFKHFSFNHCDTLLEIQNQYGGLILKIPNLSGYTVPINILSKEHTAKKSRIYVERIGTQILFRLDKESTDPILFIAQNGFIYTKDYDDSRTIHLIYESITILIEQYALLTEYRYLTYFSSSFLHVLDFKHLKKELSGLEFITECSDLFNFCCKNDQIIIIISPWLEGEGQWMKIYGINDKSWKDLRNKLIKKGFVE
ncbi:MAG: hypothetical protein ACPGSD_11095 [Flavobacteriales bacterium]